MFHEAQRNVFGPYFNGSTMVYGDPLKIHRRLHQALDGEPNKWLEQANSENPAEANVAKDRLLPAAQLALEMVPFDPATGHGSLEQDIEAALRTYLEWLDAKKESGPTPPTSWQPTLVVGPQTSEYQNWTIPDLSASGPTSPESVSNGPGR